MKNLISQTLIILLVILCVSCEKFTTDSDINGYWIGTWESDQEASGTFIVEVSQDKTQFTGDRQN